MKKPTIIRPLDIRVFGNLMPSFSKNTQLKNVHTSCTYKGKTMINGINQNTFTLTAKGDPTQLSLAITSPTGATSPLKAYENQVIGLLCTFKTDPETVGVSSTPIVNHNVYIAVDDELVDQRMTDVNGEVSYNYTCNKPGIHIIKFYTRYEDGYEGHEATVQINGAYETTLTLEPKMIKTSHTIPANLVAVLKRKDGSPVKNAKIHLYENELPIKNCYDNYKTDITGQLIYPYIESKNFNDEVKLNITQFPTTIIQHEQYIIKGNLSTKKDGTGINNQLVSLYLDYKLPPVYETRTDNDGNFELNLKLDDSKQHTLFIANNRTGSSFTDDTQTRLLYDVGLYIHTVKATPTPTITVVESSTKVIPGQTLSISATLSDEKVSFENDIIIWYYSLDNTNWKQFTKNASNIVNENNTVKTNFTYDKKATIYIKCEYQGNSVYAKCWSRTVTINYNPELIYLLNTYEPNYFRVGETTNINTLMNDSNHEPISGYDLLYYAIPYPIEDGGSYEMEGVETEYIGTAKTGSKGIATISWTPKIRGDYIIQTKYNLSLNVQKYEATTIEQFVIVTKRGRNLEVEIKYDQVISSTDPIIATFKLIDTKSGEALVEDIYYNFTRPNGVKSKDYSITMTKEGVVNVPLSDITSTGDYTLRAWCDSNLTYYKTEMKEVSFKVHEKQIPEYTYDSIVIAKGSTINIQVNCPKDYTGELSLVLLNKSETTSFTSSVTPENGVALFEDVEINFDVGNYQYAVKGTGDINYISGIDEDNIKDLRVYGVFVILCLNADSSNNINTTRLTNLRLNGNVKDPYGENYTGIMELYLNGSKFMDINVSEGQFGEVNGSIVDGSVINTDDTRLKNGTNDITLKCTDDVSGSVGEVNYKLNVNKSSINPLRIVDIDCVVNENQLFKCEFPKSIDGTITFYETDSNGSHKNTINSYEISKQGDIKEGSNPEESYIVKPLQYLQDKKYKGGTYYYTAKLTNDSKYADCETQPATIEYYTKPIITVGTSNISAYENQELKISVSVLDAQNKNYNGVLDVETKNIDDDTISTSTLTIKDGTAEYNVPTSPRECKVGNYKNISEVTFKYNATDIQDTDISSSRKQALITSSISNVYNIPTELAGFFINNNSNFSDDQFDEMVTNGKHTDLFVYVSSADDTLISQVYAKKTTYHNFRLHIVVPTLSTSTITYANGIVDGTIDAIKTKIQSIINEYPNIDGVCFDYLRYFPSSENGPTKNRVNIISKAMNQLNDYVRELAVTKNHTYITSSTVMPDGYHSEYKCNFYNQSFKEFSKSLDYVLPMFYTYNFLRKEGTNTAYDGLSFYQMQDIIRTIINGATAGGTTRNNIIGILQTYKGDGNESQLIGVQELIYNTMAMTMFTNSGYIYFRAGLTKGLYSTPTQVRNRKSNADAGAENKVERSTVVKLKTTSISKTTASTDGIMFSVLDKYGGYVEGGTATIYIDGTSMELTNCISSSQKTSMAITSKRWHSFKVKDISTIETGQHTIRIGYGNVKQGVNSSSSGVINVTFTT